MVTATLFSIKEESTLSCKLFQLLWTQTDIQIGSRVRNITEEKAPKVVIKVILTENAARNKTLQNVD